MKELTDANFGAEVLNAKGVVVVDFWAVWCGPCRALAPQVDALAKEYEGRIVVGKMDVDANPEIPSQYGITSIPTVMFFKDGQLVDKHVGATNKKTLAEKVDALL